MQLSHVLLCHELRNIIGSVRSSRGRLGDLPDGHVPAINIFPGLLHGLCQTLPRTKTSN